MIARIALVGWFVLWAGISLPWGTVQWTPSFRHVELIPFQGGSPRGFVLNLLVFVPLGILGIRLGWHPRTVMLLAAAVSALTEFSQLFSRGRYPSITDLILNVSGALVGVAIAIGLQRTGRQRARASGPAI